MVGRIVLAIGLHPLDVSLPDPHGQLVGNQQSFGRIGEELLPDVALLVQGPEDVAHGQVQQVGHLPQHRALGALSGTRIAEQQDRPVGLIVGHACLLCLGRGLASPRSGMIPGRQRRVKTRRMAKDWIGAARGAA